MDHYTIEAMLREDWDQVRQIYVEGIETGHATFETEAPDFEGWDMTHLTFARLVARQERLVKGWAALSSVSSRPGWDGVAEPSVYVGSGHRGQGIGRRLLEELVDESALNGIWALRASVFPENVAGVKLHKRCGFGEVERRERTGKLNGVWRDTVLLKRATSLLGED